MMQPRMLPSPIFDYEKAFNDAKTFDCANAFYYAKAFSSAKFDYAPGMCSLQLHQGLQTPPKACNYAMSLTCH